MDNGLFFNFSDDGRTYISKKAANIKTIYAPICGTDSSKLKSSITPFLSGDIKIDKYRYLTKPVSTEDLRLGTRNFYINFSNGEVLSVAENKNNVDAIVEGGFLWHKLTQKHPAMDIEIINFMPVSGENVELMRIVVKNTGKTFLKFTATAAVAIFGRSLANKHDHEHVTSLLHRIKQVKHGVIVAPTMRFNEEGHKSNETAYFVLGCDHAGTPPAGTFPTAAFFYGDSGTLESPEAILNNTKPRLLNDNELQGKEAVGALQFAQTELAPGSQAVYLISSGIVDNINDAEPVFSKFNSGEKVLKALKTTEDFWNDKISSISFGTGADHFNNWTRWVTLQPVLRRIYGCSFLPDHDYGKGGKGWRDLWQDLLSLILIEPKSVRPDLINNYGGIRIDGTNATIIGTTPGEFIADRNAITRVWMDHGVWPFLTTKLYIDQTGDYDLLFEKNNYFRDPQMSRTFKKDTTWTPGYGQWLKAGSGEIYKGTLLEHILVQNLVQFFNVGEHNITRLESADWNDGLDMAFKRGESVTFMAFYAGNLIQIADLLEQLMEVKKINEVEIAEELTILLDTLNSQIDYNSVKAKQELLFNKYFEAVQPEISGTTVKVKTSGLIQDLRRKAQWISDHIKSNEKINVTKGENKYTWFNGYYDNQGKRVEGLRDEQAWITLTGQVFPIMSGIADENDIKQVVESVRSFLKDKELGGFRLNSDFGLSHYLDMGRAFGFAYGTKENGAFFSHMTVMYAYALYSRGFVKEGFEVLDSIYKMSIDDKAKIYPGVPEYFDSTGKGMYHYLTGSASWYILTLLTQVFGVRGLGGDLVLEPKLLASQFDKEGLAKVSCQFGGKQVTVVYENKNHLDYDSYKIGSASIEGKKININTIDGYRKSISREVIKDQPDKFTLTIELK